MTNSIIRRVIILGALAILGLVTVQTYWVLRTWNIQEREFNRRVNQALLDAANKLAVMSGFDLKKVRIVEQLSSNYWVVNVDNVFEPTDLEFCLNEAFQVQSLKEDYLYGIFDCTNNQMVSGKLIKYSQKTIDENIEPLPKHNNSEFDHYFGVQFPGKNANILSSMWLVVVFTALMLITVAFFIYTMIVILRQKQLSEMQRDFINNMTHEFKTPISTINISTDVFLQNPLIRSDTRLNRYAGIIKEQVLRLNTQVEKVLQLAKIERNTIELHLEPVQLDELIRNISHSIELKVNEKAGQLTLDLPEAGVWVMADRLHLTNIIHNLVDNATKYAKGAPDIRIGLIKQDKRLQLSVSDKGIGIAKEHQKRIFDKFYRVPTGNIHNVKGFGLGLYYVKTICKEHRWKLNLHSEVDKGTIVEISMPVSAKG